MKIKWLYYLWLICVLRRLEKRVFDEVDGRRAHSDARCQERDQYREGREEFTDRSEHFHARADDVRREIEHQVRDNEHAENNHGHHADVHENQNAYAEQSLKCLHLGTGSCQWNSIENAAVLFSVVGFT